MDITYGCDPDLILRCGSSTFTVHRIVLSLASPVWRSMLFGEFQEASLAEIELREDDPDALKLALDILYHGILGTTGEKLMLDKSSLPLSGDSSDSPVDVVAEKYQLAGAQAYIRQARSSAATDRRLQQVQQELYQLQSRLKEPHLMNKSRSTAHWIGQLVNVQDRPPIGTRVKETVKHWEPKSGKIIANDEDFGTEIGVRWDDGTESHNLHCGKKEGWALKYWY